MIKRDQQGKFVSIQSDDEEQAESQTFMRITNADLYHVVQGIDERLARVEVKLSYTAKVWAMVVPSITCISGAIMAAWYVQH